MTTLAKRTFGPTSPRSSPTRRGSFTTRGLRRGSSDAAGRDAGRGACGSAPASHCDVLYLSESRVGPRTNGSKRRGLVPARAPGHPALLGRQSAPRRVATMPLLQWFLNFSHNLAHMVLEACTWIGRSRSTPARPKVELGKLSGQRDPPRALPSVRHTPPDGRHPRSQLRWLRTAPAPCRLATHPLLNYSPCLSP